MVVILVCYLIKKCRFFDFNPFGIGQSQLKSNRYQGNNKVFSYYALILRLLMILYN